MTYHTLGDCTANARYSEEWRELVAALEALLATEGVAAMNPSRPVLQRARAALSKARTRTLARSQ